MGRDGGAVFGFIAVVAVVLLFTASRALGCDFFILAKAAGLAVVVLGLAWLAGAYLGVDVGFVAAVAATFIWAIFFPVIDSIALGGIDPARDFSPLARELPLWAGLLKWGGLGLTVALAGWRGMVVYRRRW